MHALKHVEEICLQRRETLSTEPRSSTVIKQAGRSLHGRRQPRRGVVLICVLVCLSVVVMLTGTIVNTTLLTQRRLRSEQTLRQAEWLVEAGLERAVFQLAQIGDYQGETWNLDAATIGGAHAAEVTINVSPDEADDQVTISVVALYPVQTTAAVRRSRTIHVHLSRGTDQDANSDTRS